MSKDAKGTFTVATLVKQSAAVTRAIADFEIVWGDASGINASMRIPGVGSSAIASMSSGVQQLRSLRQPLLGLRNQLEGKLAALRSMGVSVPELSKSKGPVKKNDGWFDKLKNTGEVINADHVKVGQGVLTAAHLIGGAIGGQRPRVPVVGRPDLEPKRHLDVNLPSAGGVGRSPSPHTNKHPPSLGVSVARRVIVGGSPPPRPPRPHTNKYAFMLEYKEAKAAALEFGALALMAGSLCPTYVAAKVLSKTLAITRPTNPKLWFKIALIRNFADYFLSSNDLHLDPTYGADGPCKVATQATELALWLWNAPLDDRVRQISRVPFMVEIDKVKRGFKMDLCRTRVTVIDKKIFDIKSLVLPGQDCPRWE